MERLTEKRDGQNVIPLRQNGKIKWSICSAGLGDAPTKYLYGDHADRLAAYEDTGLEPEEIEKAMDIVKSAVSAFEDFGVDRLAELAQADREGRCIVLPCKKGDTVWRIVHDAAPHITKDRCTDIKYENRDIWVHLIGDRVMGGWNFGKLLFLNEKEAEVALKAREQDGNNK